MEVWLGARKAAYAEWQSLPIANEAGATVIEAALSRARIEGAKAMQEAAVKAVQDNLAFSIKVIIIKAIRALDPVKIAGGE
jgi:hypothetical protein